MVGVKPCWYKDEEYSHGAEMCDPDGSCRICNNGEWETGGQIFEGMPDYETLDNSPKLT